MYWLLQFDEYAYLNACFLGNAGIMPWTLQQTRLLRATACRIQQILHSFKIHTVWIIYHFLQMSVHKCCEQMADIGAAAITFGIPFIC